MDRVIARFGKKKREASRYRMSCADSLAKRYIPTYFFSHQKVAKKGLGFKMLQLWVAIVTFPAMGFTSALLVFIATLVLPAHADSVWKGFKPAELVKIGPSDFINNAVVMVRTVGGTSLIHKENYEIIDVDRIRQVKNRKRLAHEFNRNDWHMNFRAIQIETCRKQGLKFCPVFTYAGSSTGFFENGSRLHMCRHSFHNWLLLASRRNNRNLNTLSPPMVIHDKDKKVLYNSALAAADEMIKVGFLNLDPMINRENYGDIKGERGGVNLTTSDYIELVSPRQIVGRRDVEFSGLDQLKEGRLVYMAGFPGKTNIFGNGEGDTKGFSLVVSVGPIIRTSERQNAAKVGALSAPGMSGGPMLLEDGRLAGMVCNSDDNTTATTTLVLERSALERHWRNKW